MKTIIFSAAVFVFLLFNAAAQQSDYSQLKAAAEKEYSQQSFQRAHEIYARADKSKLSATEIRWVEFRLADTSWRAERSTTTADTTKVEEARKQLEELIRAADKDVDRDLVWAEAHESLGDSNWTGAVMNWSGAWTHYQQALDWWAGQREVDLARDRYLRIVFRASASPTAEYDYYGNNIPLNILENALKISNTALDRSHVNYLIAMSMRQNNGGDIGMRQRVPDYFEDALSAGKQSAWYDDALFYYAEWMNNTGPIREIDGQWRTEPDYVKALELYRRLTTEFTAGQSRFQEQAVRQIINITTAQLNIGVSNIFLPESELQFAFNSRNLRRLDFALYKIDLTREIPAPGATDKDEGEGMPGNWLLQIPTRGKQPLRTWTKNLNADNYKPTNEQSRIEGKLPLGAYLLEARGDAGGTTARDVLVVSDATMVLKTSGKQALVFFSNALTSAPIANANVTLWENYYDNDWRWRRLRQTTDADGVAKFALRQNGSSRSVFVTANGNDRQALANAQSYSSGSWEGKRVYAFTDRPAYRPKETV